MINLLSWGAAGLVACLGIAHFGYAVHDCLGAPKYFRPLDASLLGPMQNTKTALAPDGASYWAGILGFHLSHSLGVLMYALVIVITSLYDIVWMHPFKIGIGIAYTTISYKCWFRIPTVGIGVATTLLVFAWWF
jgi:hypothetical protein